MTYGKMRKQLYNVGDIVNDRSYGECEVLSVAYDNQLNFMTYTLNTEFGNKVRTNDVLTSKAGEKKL